MLLYLVIINDNKLFQVDFNKDDLDDENTILAKEGEPCISPNEFDNLVSVGCRANISLVYSYLCREQNYYYLICMGTAD